MEVSDIEFHAPCSLINGITQLENRVRNRLEPSIILRSLPKQEIIDSLNNYLESGSLTHVSFDMGMHGDKPPTEVQTALLNLFADFRDRFPEIVSDEIGIKIGAAVRADREPNHSSPINIAEYVAAKERVFGHFQQLVDHGDSRGLHFSLELEPEPSYAYSPGGKVLQPDPYSRWNNEWSHLAVYAGRFFTTATNVSRILKQFEGTSLQLDLEHLVGTSEWGNVFNLEQLGPKLEVGELSEAHRESLETWGIPLEDRDVLFDYHDLTDEEQEFVQEFGFIIRPGQPLVYAHQMTLKSQLNELSDSNVDVSSVTPGFQVYLGFMDIIDGEQVPVIGSHMPGITERYFKNPDVRNRMLREIKPVHALCWKFMKELGVKGVELEPQLDEGGKVIYDGPVWDEHADIAKDQLRENFELAEQGNVNWNDSPFYLH